MAQADSLHRDRLLSVTAMTLPVLLPEHPVLVHARAQLIANRSVRWCRMQFAMIAAAGGCEIVVDSVVNVVVEVVVG